MASVFTEIIEGRLPARFVWKDEHAVAFLTNRPIRPGHILVVPRAEVDHWLDADPALMEHLMTVARSIGKALERAYKPPKVALLIAGLEIPHLHLHLVPIWSLDDVNPANQDMNPDPADLDRAAETIRESLRALGFSHVAEAPR